MWGSKGRSGYGDSTIGGDYDSWAELSPNGKQWKNPITMLTRDLSGADYWHLRKQNRPTEEIPAELHMLKSGKANINAYADTVPTKKKTSVPLVDRVLPQQRRVRVLTEQIYELEAERKSGMDLVTYSQLRDVLICKRDRAEVLLKKALSAKPIRPESEEVEAFSYAENLSNPSDNDGHRESFIEGIGVRFIDELSDENIFKSFLKSACLVTRKVIHYKHKISSYLNELKEV